ncbi:Uncharacterized protein Fot_18665 [Forsythia ovata]|uniref:Uncharacterized protein n=1 Tax=Forsythia ovata TaxID=205694 RepID=A0ABD1VIX1_9LAMI
MAFFSVYIRRLADEGNPSFSFIGSDCCIWLRPTSATTTCKADLLLQDNIPNLILYRWFSNRMLVPDVVNDADEAVLDDIIFSDSNIRNPDDDDFIDNCPSSLLSLSLDSGLFSTPGDTLFDLVNL